MESLSTNVNVEGRSFKLTFKKGVFSFDDDFYNMIKEDYCKIRIPSNDLHEIVFPMMDLILDKFEYKDKCNFSLDIQEKLIESQNIKNKKGFIYLVSDGTYTKIGATSYNPRKRLLELQTGNAKKLNIIGYYPAEYLNITEKIIQNEYVEFNILNEWFKLKDSHIKNILDKKYSYKLDRKVKMISNASLINIMEAQLFLLKETCDYKNKKLNRCMSKNTNNTNNIKRASRIFTKDKYGQISNKTKEKYLSKNCVFVPNDLLLINKLITELTHITKWINKINKDLYEYSKEHGLYYFDEEFIWSQSEDKVEPLTFNNGKPYAIKFSDLIS